MSAGPVPAHRPDVRRGVRPRAPRRVSGPSRSRVRVSRSAGGAAAAAPRVGYPQPSGRRLWAGLQALPDSRWIDRLLRGRAWIALIGFALFGLVFMQVSMLKLNAGIGQAVERADTLERQNADLRVTVSQLSSEERIQRAAGDMGLLMPGAGDLRYVTSRGVQADAQRAVRTMRAPTTEEVTAAAAIAQAPVPPATATPAAEITTATTPASTAATPAAAAGPTAPTAPTAPASDAGETAEQATPTAAPGAASAPAAGTAPQAGATATPQSASAGAAVAPVAGGVGE